MIHNVYDAVCGINVPANIRQWRLFKFSCCIRAGVRIKIIRENAEDQRRDRIGIVETQYFTFAHPPGGFILESNDRIGPVTLAYETYGELNKDRTNAVLIHHALTGDAHAAGYHDGQKAAGLVA